MQGFWQKLNQPTLILIIKCITLIEYSKKYALLYIRLHIYI